MSVRTAAAFLPTRLVLLTALLAPAHAELNAKDFGAVGDGTTDDTLALQRSIAAAADKLQALLVPAGTYIVSSPLVVACARRELNVNPVKIRGEGQFVTVIKASAPAKAVLWFSATAPSPGVTAVVTNGHEVRDLTFDANDKADAAVLALAITRSAFRAVTFSHGVSYGLSMGFGWINQIEDCRFTGNALTALRMNNNINSVNVLNSMFENNRGIGITIDVGYAVRVTGNVFESLGGPALVARATRGLTYSSNYHEADEFNVGGARFFNESTGAPMQVCADVVLMGAQAVISPPNISIGAGNSDPHGPSCLSAVVTANYFNPAGVTCGDRYAAVASFGSHGVVVEANDCGGCGKHSPTQQCVAAADGAGGRSLANASEFRVGLNTGWTAQA